MVGKRNEKQQKFQSSDNQQSNVNKNRILPMEQIRSFEKGKIIEYFFFFLAVTRISEISQENIFE